MIVRRREADLRIVSQHQGAWRIGSDDEPPIDTTGQENRQEQEESGLCQWLEHLDSARKPRTKSKKLQIAKCKFQICNWHFAIAMTANSGPSSILQARRGVKNSIGDNAAASEEHRNY
jgi:hypothetical protein